MKQNKYSCLLLIFWPLLNIHLQQCSPIFQNNIHEILYVGNSNRLAELNLAWRCPVEKSHYWWRATIFQEYTNLFFVCLFTCEMLLKMYALGLSGYMVSLFNRWQKLFSQPSNNFLMSNIFRFDFIVVISSIMEFILVNQEVMPPLGELDVEIISQFLTIK